MLMLLENGGEHAPIRKGRYRVIRTPNGVPCTRAAGPCVLPTRSRLKAF
jgi:hypothetical protein